MAKLTMVLNKPNWPADYPDSNAGKDTVIGTTQNNTINGGNGNDILSGKAGNDTLDLHPGRRTPLLAHAAKAVTSNWAGLR